MQIFLLNNRSGLEPDELAPSYACLPRGLSTGDEIVKACIPIYMAEKKSQYLIAFIVNGIGNQYFHRDNRME